MSFYLTIRESIWWKESSQFENYFRADIFFIRVIYIYIAWLILMTLSCFGMLAGSIGDIFKRYTQTIYQKAAVIYFVVFLWYCWIEFMILLLGMDPAQFSPDLKYYYDQFTFGLSMAGLVIAIWLFITANLEQVGSISS